MKDLKDSPRAHVRIGYDGRVFKTYRGRLNEERFHNERKILRFLERQGCDFVPRVLDSDEDELMLVMSNCGQPVETMSPGKMEKLYEQLESYGVRHTDQALRNVTYDARRGRFCIIDFEIASIIDTPTQKAWSTLRWAGKTDVGRFRKRNDDHFLAFTITEEGFQRLPDTGSAEIENGDVVFVVSDGMGGAKAGDLASEMITGRLRELIPNTYQQAANQLYPDHLGALSECLADVHRAVNQIAEKKAHLKGMGATVTVCWFTPENAYFGHVGDTRLYHYGREELTQMTEDHTRAWKDWKAGKMNERQWRAHPRHHILQQAIGAGLPSVTPQLESFQPRLGDWYLLCSDGLIGGLWDKHIRAGLAEGAAGVDPEKVTNDFLTKSRTEDGRDNISLATIAVS